MGLDEDKAKEIFLKRMREEEVQMLKRASMIQQPDNRVHSKKPPTLQTQKATQAANWICKKAAKKFICCVDGSFGSDMVRIENTEVVIFIIL